MSISGIYSLSAVRASIGDAAEWVGGEGERGEWGGGQTGNSEKSDDEKQ